MQELKQLSSLLFTPRLAIWARVCLKDVVVLWEYSLGRLYWAVR